MINADNLIERYGKDVIKQNLTPEEVYVLEKNVINSDAQGRIDHLINNSFDTLESMLSFVCNFLHVDINLADEKIGFISNELLKELYNYQCSNPYFNKDRVETWDEEIDNLFDTLNRIVADSGIEFQDKIVEDLSEDRAEISNEKIRENIFNDLDDNSILLLYGLITGVYNRPYETDMRHTVFNNVKNNREKSEVGRIILHSLKENAVELGELLEHYSFTTCKDVQKNKIVLFENNNEINVVRRINKNKYSVEIINKK